jgi:hypothetical protein
MWMVSVIEQLGVVARVTRKALFGFNSNGSHWKQDLGWAC